MAQIMYMYGEEMSATAAHPRQTIKVVFFVLWDFKAGKGRHLAPRLRVCKTVGHTPAVERIIVVRIIFVMLET